MREWLPLMVACLVMLTGCSSRVEEAPEGDGAVKVYVVTDMAGPGDGGFNDVCLAGVARAEKELGIDQTLLHSRHRADFETNLTAAARKGKVVVSLGFLIADDVARVAPEFPDTKFVHIEKGEGIPADNVVVYNFRSEQAGYLAGLVAAFATKSGKVGVVAGMEIPPVHAYLAGFSAGVDAGAAFDGKAVEVLPTYVGSFDDPVKGKSLAKTLINKGCDVLFRVAGNSGSGTLEAVRENENVYLIGEDFDTDGRIPGRILTSTLKRMDRAVFHGIKMAIDGTFEPGNAWWGLAEGGVGITEMKHTRQLFSPRQLDFIEAQKEKIIGGRINVPTQ